MSDRFEDRLQAAHDARDRGDFAVARAGFAAAPDAGDLGSDDLAAFSDASWWLGLMDDTLRISEQLHQRHLDEGQAARAAMVALDLGFLLVLRGDHAVGSGWLSRARRLLADHPPCREHGYLIAMDAKVALDQGDLDTAAELARQAQASGRRFDDPALQALGLAAEGMAQLRGGDVVGGLALMDEAMLPVKAGAVQPDVAGNLYCQMMAVCHELADLDRARQWTEATMRWCDRFSSAVMFVGICRVHQVQLMHAHGTWEQAEQEARRACVELADLNVAVAAEAHYELGELHRLRDREEAAEVAYREAHRLGRDPQPGLALLRLAQGRPHTASASLEAALAAAGDNDLRRAFLLGACVEVALACQDCERARTASDELSTIAKTYDSPGYTAAAQQWCGAVLLAGGQAREAVGLLHDACRRWQALQVPYEAARVRALIARASRALGDEETASLELDAAAAALAGLGARAAVRQVAELHGPDVRPGGLTPREVEVLARVARGGSNNDVAAALFISERTVARHLANIYRKIAVSSRTAAAAYARDHGLV